jgi:hypothetical protein
MEQLKKTAHKLTEQYCQRWGWKNSPAFISLPQI